MDTLLPQRSAGLHFPASHAVSHRTFSVWCPLGLLCPESSAVWTALWASCLEDPRLRSSSMPFSCHGVGPQVLSKAPHPRRQTLLREPPSQACGGLSQPVSTASGPVTNSCRDCLAWAIVNLLPPHQRPLRCPVTFGGHGPTDVAEPAPTEPPSGPSEDTAAGRAGKITVEPAEGPEQAPFRPGLREVRRQHPPVRCGPSVLHAPSCFSPKERGVPPPPPHLPEHRPHLRAGDLGTLSLPVK